MHWLSESSTEGEQKFHRGRFWCNDDEHNEQHGLEFSADDTWAALSKNIREIQKQNAANFSFEENHRFAYNMVLYKHGAMLYDGVCALIVEHLETLARERIVPVFP